MWRCLCLWVVGGTARALPYTATGRAGTNSSGRGGGSGSNVVSRSSVAVENRNIVNKSKGNVGESSVNRSADLTPKPMAVFSSTTTGQRIEIYHPEVVRTPRSSNRNGGSSANNFGMTGGSREDENNGYNEDMSTKAWLARKRIRTEGNAGGRPMKKIILLRLATDNNNRII